MAKTFDGSGVIEAVARNGKAFKIGEDWFSVYKASQMGDAQKDDEVEFKYVEKKAGGKVFLNVEGEVVVTGSQEAEERPARGGRGGGSAPARGGRSEAPARSGGGDDKRQRSITRQNSLTQANALLATMARAGTLGELSAEELAELAVQLASTYFEPYSMVEDDE